MSPDPLPSSRVGSGDETKLSDLQPESRLLTTFTYRLREMVMVVMTPIV
jgi:hypothetical protein